MSMPPEEVAASGLVRIRPVGPDDLPALFEMQSDPESNRMAVTNARDEEAFYAHWANVLRDPTLMARVVLLDEALVGSIACFQRDGRANVGYWIQRGHWGRGIASRALRLLLCEVPTRPLYAHVATSNGASLRVLLKCGFVVERVQQGRADARHPACEEAVLVLNEGAADEGSSR